MTVNRARAKLVASFPLRLLPQIQYHKAVKLVAWPGKYLRVHPLQSNRYAKMESKQHYPIQKQKEAAKLMKQRIRNRNQEENSHFM